MYKPEKTFHIFLFTILYIFSSIVIADNLEREFIYIINNSSKMLFRYLKKKPRQEIQKLNIIWQKCMIQDMEQERI